MEETVYTVKELAAQFKMSERSIIRYIDRFNDPAIQRWTVPGTNRVHRRIPQSAVDRMKIALTSSPSPIKKATMQKKKLPPIRLRLGRKQAA